MACCRYEPVTVPPSSRTTGTPTTVGWHRPRPFRRPTLIIVEGVYAARPELADLIDFTVYLGIDPEVRARRCAQREDEPGWRGFWERGEIYYFSDVRPPASFDLQLDAEALT